MINKHHIKITNRILEFESNRFPLILAVSLARMNLDIPYSGSCFEFALCAAH